MSRRSDLLSRKDTICGSRKLKDGGRMMHSPQNPAQYEVAETLVEIYAVEALWLVKQRSEYQDDLLTSTERP